MPIVGLEKLINGIVLLVLGTGIMIVSKKMARACRASKVKIFGEARYDDGSEFLARCGILFIGVMGIIGGCLLIYQYFYGP